MPNTTNEKPEINFTFVPIKDRDLAFEKEIKWRGHSIDWSDVFNRYQHPQTRAAYDGWCAARSCELNRILK